MTAVAPSSDTTGWKGLRLSTLELFGVCRVPGGAVSVPFRDEKRRVLRERFFGPDGSCWWGPGTEAHLFGRERLPHTAVVRRMTAVVWCEGESDALAFEEAFGGYGDELAGLYISVASPGASVVKSGWAALLHGIGLIYVAGDGDMAGRAFNRRVRALLPWARVLPMVDGTDLREVAQTYGRAGVLELMDEADRARDLHAALVLAHDVHDFVALARPSMRNRV